MYGCINFKCANAYYNRHGCRYCQLTDRPKTDVECYICNHDHQCNYCIHSSASSGCALKH